jgi:hypothetical protein
MNIPTKFDLGQTVVVIWHSPTERRVPCAVCDGTGWIHLHDKRYLCPECHGHYFVREHIPARWHVANTGIVGRIQAETITHDGYPEDHHLTKTEVGDMKINYMIDTTGIGSGTLHYEPNVFATTEEAQAECDRRNAAATEVSE